MNKTKFSLVIGYETLAQLTEQNKLSFEILTQKAK